MGHCFHSAFQNKSYDKKKERKLFINPDHIEVFLKGLTAWHCIHLSVSLNP